MKIKRRVIGALLQWKNKPSRKPLVIQGARQVGKTWMMREFGENFYKNTVYLNFDDMRELHELFTPNLDTGRIIASLEQITHTKIEPENTLIIFDEIQECNRALVSLKYFCENAPEYHIIAAGSFLGVALHEGNTFPVGKVEIKTLYPLTFFEFLEAAGEGGLVLAAAEQDFARIQGVRSRYIEMLKHYFFTGGMPEAVLAFANDRNLERVREVQRAIVKSYSADFSKHIGHSDIPKVNMLWNSLPAQLAREKKKFVYNDMKSGARARDYENALSWLVKSGLVYQINRVNHPGLPLISYQEREHFKLYMLDVGLLAAKTGLDITTLLAPDTSLFNHFKGALTEQYVLQELKALNGDLPVFYWTNAKNSYEIDFIIQKWDTVVPLEVKSETNLKSKSLKSYIELNKPQKAVRASLVDYNRHGVMYEFPLYLMAELFKMIG
ncbi:MAG: ATP-binding protein [Treponema sp.]|jgi:predicted AAA+ superfamily ATPase|nr:ATP-binding protein [Treponema sp.]